MDRITGATTIDIGGGRRGFQDQILSTGGGSQEGTIVKALWLNDVQEEILNVIEGAGLAADGGSRTQLLQAIDALIVAAFTGNQNFAARWAMLPGGLTFQWGYVNIPGTGGATWTYPISFNHDCIMVCTMDVSVNSEKAFLSSKGKSSAVIDNYPGEKENGVYVFGIGY